MAWHRTILTGGLTVFLIMLLARPHGAAAAPPLLVQETEAQLVAAGCERVELKDNKALVAAESLDWQAVVPADATGEALVFCPSATAGVLKPLGEGQVAGLSDNINNLSVSDLMTGLVPGSQWNLVTKVFTGRTPLGWLTKGGSEMLAGGMAFMLEMLAEFAVDLMEIVVELIPVLLTQSTFINSPTVQRAWPIVLGAANGGFLLALVFIALLTTLRLEVGGGVRRLLPRLLIAALLVNFSLVIGGLILDLSRIVMALAAYMMGMEDIDAMPKAIISGAESWMFVFASNAALDWAGWEKTVGALLQVVVEWTKLAAVLIVVFGLLVRYVALLVLLAISPLAYLFIALPGASGLAKKWWSAFLRYVIYGPVVLVLLIMAVKSTRYFNASDFNAIFNVKNDPRQLLLVTFFSATVFTAFMVFAALAGRYAGIVGSATAIALATGAGRRVRGMAYGGAKGIAKGVAAPVTVPARGLAKGIGKGTRDYIGAQTKGFLGAAGARIMAGFGYGPKDKPPGKKFGERVFGKPLTPQQGREAVAARSFTPSGANDAQRAASIHGSTAWSPSLLRQDHVGGELTETQRRSVMDNPEVNRAYKVALAGNAEAFKKMTAAERDNIEKLDVNLDVNLPTTGVGGATATANRAQNQRNAIQNETNRAVQRAYYQMLDRLIRQSQAPPTP